MQNLKVAAATATGASVSGRTLTITFDKNLDTGQTAAPNRFRYTRGDGTVLHNPRSVAIAGKTVTLTLRHTIAPGETVNLYYSKPAYGGVHVSGGPPVGDFSFVPVTNDTADVTPPRVVDAYTNADGDAFIIEFDEGVGCSDFVIRTQLKVNTTVRPKAATRMRPE